MAYEKKDGDIAIFKNEKKSDKAPDYSGTVRVNGADYNVSLWLKESKNGKGFLSGSVDFQRKFESKKNDFDFS